MANERILILEDEKLIRWSIRERLATEEYDVVEVVVGLPLNLKGKATASTEGARKLAGLVAQATGLPVHMADERFTSKTAEEVLITADVRRSRRKQVVDKVAAAILLQAFLDGRR